MNYLMIFLLGIFVVEIVFPLFQEILEVVLSWLEVIKGFAVYKVSKINKQVAELELPESSASAIGFEVPDIEEMEDDEEPISTEITAKNKNKIGY